MKIFGIFDFVGYEPKISVYGSERYKTYFGVIMGFICSMGILGLSIYFTKILFDRTDMSIIQNIRKDTEKPVNLTNSLFYYNVVDAKLNSINPKFYDIKMDFWKFGRKNPNDPLTPDITQLSMEDCDREKHFGIYKDNLSMPLIGSKCLKPGQIDLSLHGIYGNSMPYSFINVAINFCNNATMNNTCPPESELAPILRNVFLTYAYIDYEVDHNDLENPLKKYLNFKSSPINWDLNIRYIENIGIVNYLTDDNYVFEDHILVSAYQNTKSDSSVSIRHGSALYPRVTFASLSIFRDPKVITYNKSFLKLQTLLAKIGGILNALTFIFKFFSSLITKNLLLEKMINDYTYFGQKGHNKSIIQNFNNLTFKFKAAVNENIKMYKF